MKMYRDERERFQNLEAHQRRDVCEQPLTYMSI